MLSIVWCMHADHLPTENQLPGTAKNDDIIDAEFEEVLEEPQLEPSSSCTPHHQKDQKQENAVEDVTGFYELDSISEPVLRAKVKAGDYRFVIQALSQASDLSPKLIQRLLQEKKAKHLVTVCWMAGLSASFAYLLQIRMAQIVAKHALAPIDGNYPLDQERLQLHSDILHNLNSI